MALHLVRHGLPAIVPDRPAAEWLLSSEGTDDVLRLRDSGVLPTDAVWLSSPEPKALSTAELLTATAIGVVDDLHEAGRPAAWFDDVADFAAVVRRSFADPTVAALAGWEPLTASRVRVTRAVRSILDIVNRDVPDVVLVGHGTAWTLLVAELTGNEPDLGGWAALGMPDHCTVDVERGVVTSPWGGWASAGAA